MLPELRFTIAEWEGAMESETGNPGDRKDCIIPKALVSLLMLLNLKRG